MCYVLCAFMCMYICVMNKYVLCIHVHVYSPEYASGHVVGCNPLQFQNSSRINGLCAHCSSSKFTFSYLFLRLHHLSFIQHFAYLLCFNFQCFWRRSGTLHFFFLILRSSFFLPCLLLSVFPPSFCLLTSCLFLSYYHYSLNSLLLFYGKNIISNFTKDSRL